MVAQNQQKIRPFTSVSAEMKKPQAILLTKTNTPCKNFVHWTLNDGFVLLVKKILNQKKRGIIALLGKNACLIFVHNSKRSKICFEYTKNTSIQTQQRKICKKREIKIVLNVSDLVSPHTTHSRSSSLPVNPRCQPGQPETQISSPNT